MSFFAMLVVVAFAIENLTDIIVTVPWFVKPREYIGRMIHPFGKLVDCKYCQCWWLSAMAAAMFPSISSIPQPLSWLVIALCLHRMAQFMDGIYEKYLRVLQPETIQDPMSWPVDMDAEVERIREEQENLERDTTAAEPPPVS